MVQDGASLLSNVSQAGSGHAATTTQAGTGGNEAAIFAGDLYRMYTRYAESNRYKYEILTESGDAFKGTFQEAGIEIPGIAVPAKAVPA